MKERENQSQRKRRIRVKEKGESESQEKGNQNHSGRELKSESARQMEEESRVARFVYISPSILQERVGWMGGVGR